MFFEQVLKLEEGGREDGFCGGDELHPPPLGSQVLKLEEGGREEGSEGGSSGDEEAGGGQGEEAEVEDIHDLDMRITVKGGGGEGDEGRGGEAGDVCACL